MKMIFKTVLTISLLSSATVLYAQQEEAERASSIGDLNAELGIEFAEMAQGNGRAVAPVDLTGTWVSIVNEDWRFRMVTPQIGDFANIPENEAAREFAMEWRPELDVGNECRAYGAPAIMHEPGRIKISWEDDLTLKLEFDAGHQVRYLHFNPNAQAGQPSRQGHSLARWERPRGQQISPVIANTVPIGQQFPRTEGVSNALQVFTDNIVSGYLRKNGIPHSDQVEVREYFDLITIPDGSEWLIVNIVVEDPVYLEAPWITSMNFKKESDDSKWNPQDCFVTNPGW